MSPLTRHSATVSLLLLFACGYAQPYARAQGGKAEPLRIEFKRGASNATYRDKLRGDEQMEYEFSARQGQTVSVRLKSAPSASIDIRIINPDGQPLRFDERDRRIQSAQLHQTGTYSLVVKRTTSTRGSSSYSFTISIQ